MREHFLELVRAYLCIQNCVHHMMEQCRHLMGVYFPALICVIASKRLLQIWQGYPFSIDCKLKSKIIFLILSIQMFQNCLRNASCCKCLRSQGSLSIYFARYISIYLSKQIGLTDVILPQHLFVVSLLNIWFCVPKLKQGQIRKVHLSDSQNLAILREIQTKAEQEPIIFKLKA